MTFKNLIRQATGKKVIVNTGETTWKGTLTDHDKNMLNLSNASILDNISGNTPADGQILLPITTISYMQILNGEQ